MHTIYKARNSCCLVKICTSTPTISKVNNIAAN
nr:MAG TPA: hypothetical protein [Caudoviricetes sp.]